MKRYAEALLQLNPKSHVKLNAFSSKITKTWICLVCILESFACFKVGDGPFTRPKLDSMMALYSQYG